MPIPWIIDSGPFIGLAKIGRLPLLVNSERTVYLPAAVAREIGASALEDAAVKALDQLQDIGISVLPATPISPQVSAFRLDAGEFSVLTEALLQPGSVAVIDEAAGRAAAKALQIRLTGTVGVLVLAQKQKTLAAIAPELRKLQEAEIYLPREDALRILLEGLGESWP